jgi:hypothetical protein
LFADSEYCCTRFGTPFLGKLVGCLPTILEWICRSDADADRVNDVPLRRFADLARHAQVAQLPGEFRKGLG